MWQCLQCNAQAQPHNKRSKLIQPNFKYVHVSTSTVQKLTVQIPTTFSALVVHDELPGYPGLSDACIKVILEFPGTPSASLLRLYCP